MRRERSGIYDLRLQIINMKRIFYILTVLAMVACQSEGTKIAYVQNMRLYSEFDLAKELDSELKSFSDKKGKELDSLTLIFENMTRDFERMEEIPAPAYQQYNDLRNAIIYKEKSFEEEVYSQSQEYDQQIWERINGYIVDYAEQEDYDLILGASGNGNLMYAKDTLDITDELIIYCNKNYNGEK